MLLFKLGIRQVYEIILLLANLNYLVIWRDNLKLSQYPKQKCIFVYEGDYYRHLSLMYTPFDAAHEDYYLSVYDKTCEN